MDLPAVDRLGYGIDLLGITPFDIGAVDDHLILRERILKLDLSQVRDVVIGGVTYKVPVSVSVTNDTQIVRGEYITFPDGQEAAKQFSGDASYPLRYFAVSGTTSGAQAARKSFLKGFQFAFFSYTEGSYDVRLRNYDGALDEDYLLRILQGVPNPFNSTDKEGVNKFRDFFSRYGSHVTLNANYGARYPLKAWASNKSSDVNQMFNTDVKAKFNGIPSGGNFDASVKAQDQYKRFAESFQFLVTVSGGGDRSKLANTEATYSDYTKWIESIKAKSPGLLSFQVIELWDLMNFAKSSVIKSYVDPLRNAFMWIVGHPAVYKTSISLDIQSDWAEFNLLTPSAVILPDPAHPYPSTNMVASDTRVQWGKEYSHVYQRQTLRFFVINDGSPIDFSTSHGSESSDSARSNGGGKAIVLVMDNQYTNDVITDNVWNTKWFYNVPVNPNPEPTSANRADKPFYEWDEVLEEYLRTNA